MPLGVAHLFEVGDQGGAGGVPSQAFLREGAGGRHVPTDERREPAKVVGRLFGREADDRHFQASTDDFSDVPNRYAFFSDRVISRARISLLQGEPIETGDIEDVRRRPAVESVADIGRDTLFAGEFDGVGDETLLDGVVDLREPHHRDVRTALGHRNTS